jgi:hypothetical protein
VEFNNKCEKIHSGPESICIDTGDVLEGSNSTLASEVFTEKTVSSEYTVDKIFIAARTCSSTWTTGLLDA